MISKFGARFHLNNPAAASFVKISCATLLAAGLFAGSPAAAHDRPTTRLVTCGEQSCLRIEGRRENAGTVVAINGAPMEVDGAESWQITLPLAKVRQIAEQGARRLEVTLLHPDTRSASRDFARLPIGLLGDTTDLEAIRVTAS